MCKLLISSSQPKNFSRCNVATYFESKYSQIVYKYFNQALQYHKTNNEIHCKSTTNAPSEIKFSPTNLPNSLTSKHTYLYFARRKRDHLVHITYLQSSSLIHNSLKQYLLSMLQRNRTRKIFILLDTLS